MVNVEMLVALRRCVGLWAVVDRLPQVRLASASCACAGHWLQPVSGMYSYLLVPWIKEHRLSPSCALPLKRLLS